VRLKARRLNTLVAAASVSCIALIMCSIRYASADSLSWVFSPFEFPLGLIGTNNCTFGFAQNLQWDFHPDGGCWEHTGPEGWVRQQQNNVHIPTHARCGGEPGDSTSIRICRRDDDGSPVQGYPAPCGIRPTPEFPTTGPNGCSVCYVRVTCHLGEEFHSFGDLEDL